MAGEFCSDVVPLWLKELLGEEFFNPCLAHENERKNEENRFCLDCSARLCTHCLPSHQTHYLLQIKRYMYRDVLGLNDAAKLIDCSFVQSYTINSAKVVFLKHKQVPKQSKGSSNMCIVCERSLNNSFLFCSISCKVQQIFNECGNAKHCNSTKLEDSYMSQDSMLQPQSSTATSCGVSTRDGEVGSLPSKMSSCSLTSEFAKKKRSPRSRQSSTCLPAIDITTPVSRRKSAPRRSPMY